MYTLNKRLGVTDFTKVQQETNASRMSGAETKSRRTIFMTATPWESALASARRTDTPEPPGAFLQLW